MNVENGKIKMLNVKQSGQSQSYMDIGLGAGVDVNFGFTGSKFYYTGSLKSLTFSNAFSGISHQIATSAGALGVDFSGTVSVSANNRLGHRTYGIGAGIGVSPAPFHFGGSYLRNETFLDPWKNTSIRP